MTALAATVVVLGVLILVHELGHFWAAKSVGVKVLRFSIGLGPPVRLGSRLLGFRRGDTEYVISAIPLGGYVKMSGMADEAMDRVEGGDGEAPREPEPTDFDGKPLWARALVLSAGVIMNMVFAFATYTVIAAAWGRVEAGETRVGHVDMQLLPPGAEALGGLPVGARIVRVDGRDVEHWGDVEDGFLFAQGETVTVETESPRVTVSVPTPRDSDARMRMALSLEYWIEAEVLDVEPGAPAARAGIRSGDRILAVDGVDVANWAPFRHEIQRRPGRTVELRVLRDGTLMEIAVPLASREQRWLDGEIRTVGRAGILPSQADPVYVPVPPTRAVVLGYRETVGTTRMILASLRDLVTGNVSPRNVGSIVSIGAMSGQAAEAGPQVFLRFMALFSVNLAILNLLPIPILDGGHLLFLGIEALRGRALSIEQRLRWSRVGLLMIMGLMVWALSNDMLRVFGL